MRRYCTTIEQREDAVSHLIEYIIISGILLLIIAITMPLVSTVLIERPAEQLSYYAYTDIANGVSTRIVDMYAISSDFGSTSIVSQFDLPDSVAGREYFVRIEGDGQSQNVTVFRGNQRCVVSIAGIGIGRKAIGETTGHGVNQITYNY